MYKQLVHAEVESLSLEYTEVTDLIILLQDCVKKYGPTCRIEKQYDYGRDDGYYAVMAQRLETDSECLKREYREAQMKLDTEKRDAEEYARLQKKFAKDVE